MAETVSNPAFGDEKYQRAQWETLVEAVEQHVRTLRAQNVREVVFALFKLDLKRARGVLVQSLMKEQAVNPEYTAVYAALVSVLNSKIPEIGTLLLSRLAERYRKAQIEDNDSTLRPTMQFIGQLVNMKVCAPLLVLQMMVALLEVPNSKNIERVYFLLQTCGRFLFEEQPEDVEKIYQKLRILLTEGMVDTRGQTIIQKCIQIRKLEFETNDGVPDDLDLVEEEDIVTHSVVLNEPHDVENNLNEFAYDQNYEANYNAHVEFKKEVLGEDEEEEEVQQTNDVDVENTAVAASAITADPIVDLSEAKLLAFQKQVYLTIMSSMGPEEAVHKLSKVSSIDPLRKEYMLVDMIFKCCTQEKTYSKYYGLIGEELIVKGGKWPQAFADVFKDTYENCGKFETTLLRNVGKFWGHMFASDKMAWDVLECVRLTEEDTTSAGRIMLKFLFQRMLEELGLQKLLARINEGYMQQSLEGIFPHKDAEHLRFSINYFTAINLGKLTDRMRESLDEMSRGRTRSRSSSGDRSGSGSRRRSGSYSSGSYSRSVSRTPSRSPSRSRTPSPRRERWPNATPASYRDRIPPDARKNLPTGPRRGGYRGRGRGSTREPYRGHRGRYGGRN